jgi:hypothetical protein
MPGHIAVQFNDAKARQTGSVIAENLQRIPLDSVEPGIAGLDLAIVGICLANLELKATAFQGFVKALVGGNLGHFFGSLKLW